jgi:hypothetical protein
VILSSAGGRVKFRSSAAIRRPISERPSSRTHRLPADSKSHVQEVKQPQRNAGTQGERLPPSNPNPAPQNTGWPDLSLEWDGFWPNRSTVNSPNCGNPPWDGSPKAYCRDAAGTLLTAPPWKHRALAREPLHREGRTVRGEARRNRSSPIRVEHRKRIRRPSVNGA